MTGLNLSEDISDPDVSLCIDPGDVTSGVCIARFKDKQKPVLFIEPKMDNHVLLYKMVHDDTFRLAHTCAIESMFYSYKVINHTTVLTSVMTGRIVQLWVMLHKTLPIPILSETVRSYFCPHNKKITDAMVKDAIRIRFDEPVGRTHAKGPLKGVDSHGMRAFATGLAIHEGARSTIADGKYMASFGDLEEVTAADASKYFILNTKHIR